MRTGRFFSSIFAIAAALLMIPYSVSAQSVSEGANAPATERSGVTLAQQDNVPQQARDAEEAVERAVRRFRIGVDAGVGVDPELIMFGGHGTFGPIFHPNVDFRPGVEFGLGEVTTLMGINLDVLYRLPGTARNARWTPYLGAGPNFTLSHRSFEDDDDDDNGNRFDFSDTDFVSGFNFFAGAETQNGMFLEFKATAWGVSNIRFLVGFNF